MLFGGFVEADVGPAIGEGAVKAFDLAVGLGSVGPGPLGGDVQFRAGITPGVVPIGRFDVGQNAFDDDAVLSEPGHGTVQYSNCGGRFLIGTNLGVSNPGVSPITVCRRAIPVLGR